MLICGSGNTYVCSRVHPQLGLALHPGRQQVSCSMRGCRVDGRYATLTSIAVCTSTHSTHKAYKMVWTPSARATTSHLQRRRGLLRRRRGWSMRISKMDTWTSWVRRAETGKVVHQVNTLTAGCAVSSALHEHGQSGTAKAARARIRAGGGKMERIVGWYTRDGDWTGVRVGM